MYTSQELKKGSKFGNVSITCSHSVIIEEMKIYKITKSYHTKSTFSIDVQVVKRNLYE
jgi:hypothetical protein